MSPKPSAFTLIELLLYIAITSSMLIVVVLFLSALLEARVKNQTIAEVEQQGLQVTQIISQTIRNADAIIIPTPSASSSSITLDVVDATLDPTVFDLSGGSIRIKESLSGPNINLTNSSVVVTGLTFQNLSSVGTPGNIRFSFTITRLNPENRNAFSYTKTFSGSASLR